MSCKCKNERNSYTVTITNWDGKQQEKRISAHSFKVCSQGNLNFYLHDKYGDCAEFTDSFASGIWICVIKNERRSK